ncbi:MAG: aminotransferase class IV family protein [Rhizobiaceae bacterium]|nr:aminotransferase class IV family protein [Rhizobiaceae bacterium]
MPAEGPLRHRLGPDDRLIETMGYAPRKGVARAELHLDRLERSAKALYFAFNRMGAIGALRHFAKGPQPLRVRFTLGSGGDLDVTTAPFEAAPAGTVWRLAVAVTRLDSADGLLAHKTTKRDIYAAARREFAADAADEVLLLNERGEVCEGTITNVFADMGDAALATPPLTSGLLPGVLRQELLEAGRAVERVLTPDDLRAAKSLFVGNSLRGLIAARLDER